MQPLIRQYVFILKLATFLVALFMGAAGAAQAEPRRYALDPKGSDIGFTYRILGQSFQGSIPVSRADIVIDFSDVGRTQAQVALDGTEARAGVALATQALRGRSVLDVDTHPTIAFRSTRTQKDENGAVMEGDLTVRGVTRPVRLRARFLRAADSDPGEREELTILLTGSVARSAFGASGYAALVDDRIDLSIRAAIRPKS